MLDKNTLYEQLYRAASALVNMKDGGFPPNMVERAYREVQDAVAELDELEAQRG